MEKLKFDVGDMIDNKFENIMLKMDQETKNLKETFERISVGLDKSGKDLSSSFEEKQHTLKTMCATFFAKMELSMTGTKTEICDLQASFNIIEGSFLNPAKLVEAKLFSINNRLSEIE